MQSDTIAAEKKRVELVPYEAQKVMNEIWRHLYLRRKLPVSPLFWQEAEEIVKSSESLSFVTALLFLAREERLLRLVAHHSPLIRHRVFYRALLARRLHQQLADNSHLRSEDREHLGLRLIQTLNAPDRFPDERQTAARALSTLAQHPRGASQRLYQELLNSLHPEQQAAARRDPLRFIDSRPYTIAALALLPDLQEEHVRNAYRMIGLSEIFYPLLEREACPLDICLDFLPTGARHSVILRSLAKNPRAMQDSIIREAFWRIEGSLLSPSYFLSLSLNEKKEALPILLRHHPEVVLRDLESGSTVFAPLMDISLWSLLLQASAGDLRMRALRLFSRMKSGENPVPLA